MRFFEIIAGGFSEDGTREGAKDFAMLDAAIQNFFHLRTTWIGDDAAVAKGSRSPFGTALKPAENFSIGDNLRGIAHEVGFRKFGDEITVAHKGARID